jgi:hypothetical protein
VPDISEKNSELLMPVKFLPVAALADLFGLVQIDAKEVKSTVECLVWRFGRSVGVENFAGAKVPAAARL